MEKFRYENTQKQLETEGSSTNLNCKISIFGAYRTAFTCYTKVVVEQAKRMAKKVLCLTGNMADVAYSSLLCSFFM